MEADITADSMPNIAHCYRVIDFIEASWVELTQGKFFFYLGQFWKCDSSLKSGSYTTRKIVRDKNMTSARERVPVYGGLEDEVRQKLKHFCNYKPAILVRADSRSLRLTHDS